MKSRRSLFDNEYNILTLQVSIYRKGVKVILYLHVTSFVVSLSQVSVASLISEHIYKLVRCSLCPHNLLVQYSFKVTLQTASINVKAKFFEPLNS